MKIIPKDKPRKELVRILIGKTHTGQSGLQAPIRQITLEETNVDEVKEFIEKAIGGKNNGSK